MKEKRQVLSPGALHVLEVRGGKAKERNRKVGGNLGAHAVLEAKEVFQGGKSDQFYCMLLIGGAREELKIAS